jgi:hypothetical protein
MMPYAIVELNVKIARKTSVVAEIVTIAVNVTADAIRAIL